MYNRYVASCFNDNIEIFTAMVDFAKLCGFTVVDENASDLSINTSESKILKDPNNSHYIWISYCEDLNSINLFMLNNYEPPEPPEPVKVVVIGDSISAGYPYTNVKPSESEDLYSWTHTFRELSGYTVINSAIGGETSADMLARFNADVISYEPDYVIIETGGNDYEILGHGTMSYYTQTCDNIRSMVQMVYDELPASTKIKFITPLVPPNMIATSNPDEYRVCMQMLRDFIVNDLGFSDAMLYYEPLLDSNGNLDYASYMVDVVHPNATGYAKVGEYLYGFCTGWEKAEAEDEAEDEDDVNIGGTITVDSTKCDLICIYNNKSLIYIYTRVDCNYFSHYSFYNAEKYSVHSNDVSYDFTSQMIFYGNFTKYHLSYNKEIVLLFSTPRYAKLINRTIVSNDLSDYFVAGFVYCFPEATHTIYKKPYFVSDVSGNVVGEPLKLKTSFDNLDDLPSYGHFYSASCCRAKTAFGSYYNNGTIVMPLILYGQREPRALGTYSPIGETKLINLADMMHISPGEIVLKIDKNEDYHKYFLFPINFMVEYKFFLVGFAVEVEAKENLLKYQEEDNLTVWLEDSITNFDKIKVEFVRCGKVSIWTYNELIDQLYSDEIFNFNKCNNSVHDCMLYGIYNENGSTTEYKLTFSKCMKVKSIIGYRG